MGVKAEWGVSGRAASEMGRPWKHGQVGRLWALFAAAVVRYPVPDGCMTARLLLHCLITDGTAPQHPSCPPQQRTPTIGRQAAQVVVEAAQCRHRGTIIQLRLQTWKAARE